MSLTLYAHPLSSYCQKVLVALYENGTAFDFASFPPTIRTPGANLRNCGRSSACHCWSMTVARSRNPASSSNICKSIIAALSA